MESQAAQPPQATCKPPPQVAPGSKESFDELVDSLTYSFVDMPELVDDDGSVVQDTPAIKSFNPFVQQSSR
jgi:hypothetical protein